MLFGKLTNQLHPDSKLIVIPDGLLNYVPYESLVHNGRYLIEDHEISYLPSASLIELLRQPPAKSDSEQKDQLDLLAFGDPVFPQQSKTPLTRKVPAIPTEVNRQAWDLDTPNLSRLPRTRDEVEYIAESDSKRAEASVLRERQHGEGIQTGTSEQIQMDPPCHS